jgi:gliding motility-associated-like protein
MKPLLSTFILFLYIPFAGAQIILKDLNWKGDTRGLKYIIYEPGNKNYPNENSRVVLTYITIMGDQIRWDSAEFRKKTKTDTMVLKDMVKGFALSASMLGEGGDGFFCVPPSLAYGAREGDKYQHQTFYFYIRLVKVLELNNSNRLDFTIDSTRKPLFNFHYKPIPENNYRWGFYNSEDITQNGSKFMTSRIYASGRNADTIITQDYRDSIGTYWVCLESMDKNGSRDTVCKRIRSNFEVVDLPPNVFIPDSSGSSKFNIHIENESYYHLTIYDRWGVKVFESKDKNYDWNGRVNNTGASCPDGTYYYVLNYRYKHKEYKEHEDQGEPILNGNIRLIW